MRWTWRASCNDLGFELVGTRGTSAAIRAEGIPCRTVFKVNEGRPNAVDLLKAGTVQLVIYTAAGAMAFSDERAIRRGAVQYRVPCIDDVERCASGGGKRWLHGGGIRSGCGVYRRFTRRRWCRKVWREGEIGILARRVALLDQMLLFHDDNPVIEGHWTLDKQAGLLRGHVNLTGNVAVSFFARRPADSVMSRPSFRYMKHRRDRGSYL